MNLSYAQIKKKIFGSSYDPTTTKMKDNKKKKEDTSVIEENISKR